MKKAIIAAILVLTLCVGTVALVACNPDNAKTEVAIGDDLYTMGYSVATAASVLGAGSNTAAASTAADTTTETTPDGFEDQLDMFEQFIDRANVKVEAGESDKEGYDFRLTVTTNTAGGEQHVYVIYYNIVADKTVDENGMWIRGGPEESRFFMENPPKKFFRLSPGKEVRLRYAYFMKCDEVVKDSSGNVVKLICSIDRAICPESEARCWPTLLQHRQVLCSVLLR